MAPCIVCGGGAWKVLRESNKRVVECESCGLERFDPLIAFGDTHTHAPTDAGYLSALLTEGDRLRPLIRTRALNRLAYFESVLGRRPKRVLEIGCGAGWLLSEWKSEGVEALGVEVDADLGLVGQQAGVDIEIGDALTAANLDRVGYFDVVTTSQVVEHIFEPKRFMERIASSLCPGGIVVIDVPNAHSWGSRVRRVRHTEGVFGALTFPDHQLGYRSSTLNHLLVDAALEVVLMTELPTDDSTFGQMILPGSTFSQLAMRGSKVLGHGYLLVGVGRKSQST